MDQYGLLSNNASNEDHVLETDIMRFLAIIGIVFWIVFSMVESIPSQTETRDGCVLIDPGELLSNSKEEKTENTIEPVEPDKANGHTEDVLQAQRRPRPSAKGVSLEFQSLTALIQLLQDNRLIVYGRAWATGFELFLQGEPLGGEFRFKNAQHLPDEMWEIRERNARNYFIQQMVQNFPSIKAFPGKSIQVAFVDKQLQRDVVNKMEQLRREDQNGVLSLTADGVLIFSPFSPTGQQKESNPQKTDKI